MIVLGGLVLALGTVVTGATLLDVQGLSGTGPNQVLLPHADYQMYIEQYATLSGIGTLLSAIGFLVAFAGVALAFRAPRKPSNEPVRRTRTILLLGGLLVAAGLAALSVLQFYSYQPFPLAFPGYYAVDLGGRIVEAIGFCLAFVGVAEALRH